jgi:hypothetical protein
MIKIPNSKTEQIKMHINSRPNGANQMALGFVLSTFKIRRTLLFGICLSFGACYLLFAAFAFSTALVYQG